MIPLVDLAAQHREIAREVDAGFASVVGRTAFILGDEVRALETAADAPGDFRDRRGRSVFLGADVKGDDAAAHCS